MAPLPIRLTLHRAPPSTRTDPLPTIDTCALPLDRATMLPEPATDTLSDRLARPAARTDPDPALDRSSRSTDPATSNPPAPAALSRARPAWSWPMRIVPDPATLATKSFATRSIDRGPDPAPLA